MSFRPDIPYSWIICENVYNVNKITKMLIKCENNYKLTDILEKNDPCHISWRICKKKNFDEAIKILRKIKTNHEFTELLEKVKFG